MTWPLNQIIRNTFPIIRIFGISNKIIMCYSIAYLERKAKKLAERYKDLLPADWSDLYGTDTEEAEEIEETAAPAVRQAFPLKVHETGTQDELPVYYFVSGFAHPLLPVIRHDGIFLHQWGLVPFWAKDAAVADDIRTKTLNAMGETVFEKPSFKGSILSKRCLLPVSGFFEWREVNKVKYPYFIRLRDEGLFSLGCIYASWTDKQTGEIRDTFSILTTPANPLMEKIHNLKKRMPLIISRSNEVAWADPQLDAAGIRNLIRPLDETLMTAHTVSRMVNNPRNERNIAEVLEEVHYHEIID